MSSTDVTVKLQLLTLHFPKLRLVWSPSPYATAQLFHEIKEGKEEPSGIVAASVGVEENALDIDRMEKYNIGIQDFVLKLPGVNTKNIVALLSKGGSLDHLLMLKQEEISDILKNSQNAEMLYNALHKPVKVTVDQAATTRNFRGRVRKIKNRKNT